MPSQIFKPLKQLSEESFKGLSIQALSAILEKFTNLQQDLADGKKTKRSISAKEEKTGGLKYVKTRELQKVLICHIIGVCLYLAPNQKLWLSVLCKTLKKDAAELKNYVKEVGFSMTVGKNPKTKETDLLISTLERQQHKKNASLSDGEGEKSKKPAVG